MVKPTQLPVRWDKSAVDALQRIFEYIKTDSPSSADKVKKALLLLAKGLGDFPEKYPREPYLLDEPNNYRSVSKWNYKLIYEVTENEVIVVMVFNTRQDPNNIKKSLQPNT